MQLVVAFLGNYHCRKRQNMQKQQEKNSNISTNALAVPRAVIELVPFRETLLLLPLTLTVRMFLRCDSFFFLLISQFVYLAKLAGHKCCCCPKAEWKPANGRGQVQGFALASLGNAVRLRLPLRSN